MNTSLIYTDYKFQFEGGQSSFSFKLFSGITDYNAKVDLTWLPDVRHNIRFGGNYVFHVFVPSNASAKSGDVVFDFEKSSASMLMTERFTLMMNTICLKSCASATAQEGRL